MKNGLRASLPKRTAVPALPYQFDAGNGANARVGYQVGILSKTLFVSLENPRVTLSSRGGHTEVDTTRMSITFSPRGKVRMTLETQPEADTAQALRAVHKFLALQQPRIMSRIATSKRLTRQQAKDLRSLIGHAIAATSRYDPAKFAAKPAAPLAGRAVSQRPLTTMSASPKGPSYPRALP